MDKILELLEKNGRMPDGELAGALEMDVKDVASKIAEYEEAGIIKGYRTIIDRAKLPGEPQTIIGIIEVTISPQQDTGFDQIAREIYDHPEVKSCYLCSGDYDLLVYVEAETLNAIAEFVARELAPLKNVRKTESHFMLKTYKEAGLYFEEPSADHRLSISP